VLTTKRSPTVKKKLNQKMKPQSKFIFQILRLSKRLLFSVCLRVFYNVRIIFFRLTNINIVELVLDVCIWIVLIIITDFFYLLFIKPNLLGWIKTVFLYMHMYFATFTEYFFTFYLDIYIPYILFATRGLVCSVFNCLLLPLGLGSTKISVEPSTGSNTSNLFFLTSVRLFLIYLRRFFLILKSVFIIELVLDSLLVFRLLPIFLISVIRYLIDMMSTDTRTRIKSNHYIFSVCFSFRFTAAPAATRSKELTILPTIPEVPTTPNPLDPDNIFGLQ